MDDIQQPQRLQVAGLALEAEKALGNGRSIVRTPCRVWMVTIKARSKKCSLLGQVKKSALRFPKVKGPARKASRRSKKVYRGK
jgi:hypothetical protein